MLVLRDEVKNTYTFVAVTEDETNVLRRAIETLTPGEKIAYRGAKKKYDTNDIVRLTFQVGGEEKMREPTREAPGGFFYEGGFEFFVEPPALTDQSIMRAIRDTCFVATSGLVFIESTQIDDLLGFVCTACFCKICGAPIIRMGRAEWKTCDACVARCEHQWKTGFMHGGWAKDLAEGEFCSVCGVGKPDQEHEDDQRVDPK